MLPGDNSENGLWRYPALPTYLWDEKQYHCPMEQQYEYHAAVSWTSEKKGLVSAEGLPTLEVAVPPEFNGHEGIWSPEHFLVAAVASCIMNTFLAIAEASKFSFAGYESSARGLLEKTDSGYQFTSIEVEVGLTVSEEQAVSKGIRLLQKAEQNCFVSNSVKAEVSLIPSVKVG